MTSRGRLERLRWEYSRTQDDRHSVKGPGPVLIANVGMAAVAEEGTTGDDGVT